MRAHLYTDFYDNFSLVSKRGKNCFLFPSVFFIFIVSSTQISMFLCLAYENQVCIGQIIHKNVLASEIFSTWWPNIDVRRTCFYGGFSGFYRTLKVNNFISFDFQTQVSIWFLISMKFCTRIINKRGAWKCNSKLFDYQTNDRFANFVYVVIGISLGEINGFSVLGIGMEIVGM